MKLFELRPLAAVLMTSTLLVASFLNPAPHPESSVTVESPTRTMRIGGALCACGAPGISATTTAAESRAGANLGRDVRFTPRAYRFHPHAVCSFESEPYLWRSVT